MKLSVNRDKLTEALQKVNSVISTRTTMQILGNVLMEAQDNKLTLSSTDLEIRVTTMLEANVEGDGTTTLPAKKFQDIVRSLSGDEITMESDEQHHMSLQCGHSRFKILGLAPDDFPLPLEMTPTRRFKLGCAEIGRMLSLITYAVNQDDTRKALNGILFNVSENNFVTVATDGRRLALVEKIIEDFNGDDGDSILPVKSANELYRLMGKEGDAVIEFGENMARFTINENTVMTSKLIDESYPNYRQVIPAAFSKYVDLPRGAFVATLRRAALVASDRSYYVQLKFANNALEFKANSAEVGECVDQLDIEYVENEIAISFNPDYLIEPLDKLDSDNVRLKMNDGFSPVALSTDDGFLYVIMPMRSRD